MYFLYSTKEESKTEIKKNIIYNKNKYMIYLGLSMMKDVLNLYIQKYKTLLREIKDSLNEYNSVYEAESSMLLRVQCSPKQSTAIVNPNQNPSRPPNKHMKRCLTLLGIREIQIKNTVRSHPKPIRIATIKRTENSKFWGGYEVIENLAHCW